MLPRINLLPWREQQREQHRKRFIGMLVAAILAALVTQYIAGMFLGYQQDVQAERNGRLNQQISLLDRQILELAEAEQEHQSLMTRLALVETLQNERNKTTEFMNLLPTLVPAGVYIDKVKMSGYEVELSGISDSTARLATMLKNFERAEVMESVDMHSIVHGERRFSKKFQTFRVSLRFNPASYERNLPDNSSLGR